MRVAAAAAILHPFYTILRAELAQGTGGSVKEKS